MSKSGGKRIIRLFSSFVRIWPKIRTCLVEMPYFPTFQICIGRYSQMPYFPLVRVHCGPLSPSGLHAGSLRVHPSAITTSLGRRTALIPSSHFLMSRARTISILSCPGQFSSQCAVF